MQQERYDGPKKPAMPPEQALNHIPTLSFLASQAIAVQRAVENDFVFLQDIHTQPKCHEYNGFNTRLSGEAGMLSQHKTDVAFLPLVDRLPAHHDTTKTAMDKGLTLMRAAGDNVLIFMADQQLCKSVIHIVYYQPTYFQSVITVLGGMHMLMNFIHATAVIVAGGGTNDILAVTFESVEKMLSGKKYPQNFHQNARKGDAPVYT